MPHFYLNFFLLTEFRFGLKNKERLAGLTVTMATM